MEEMKVYAIKLVTGEEIIARVDFGLSIGDEIILHDARTLFMKPTGELSLAPVLFTCDPDKSIELKKNAIVLMSKELREQFLDAYNESTSLLALPKKKIIMEG